ncbi:MAG TPA: hypothetical protein DCQ51_06725 [Planktothrix sp. UBA8407]|jgi:Non-ribosomal peptide synthetase modules and related proteins|nr:hypothetical protein [Planktothrix sp. UBA8407]HBK24398.1 hypothetical protein [Planktothrix sp. UBA10369]
MKNSSQIIDLISQLRELGCRISVDGEKLRLRTTKNTLPAELTATIKARKAEIISFLNAAKTSETIFLETIPTLPEHSPKPLSFAQQQLWTLAQWEGDLPTYNMPLALQIEGDLHIEALAQSLTAIVDRHSSLRMYFPKIAGQPQIGIHTIEDFTILSQEDLRHLEPENQSITAQQLIDAHGQEPFNLETGPLFKAKLLLLQANKFILLINMHHICSDGWSMGIFMRELREAYRAFSLGEKPVFSPLPIQYSDFAAWQRNRLKGETLQPQINYWKNQLKNAPLLSTLPTDYPRPVKQSYQGDYYDHSFSIELTKKLNTLSQEQGACLFMVLLAAFSFLLSRYIGQNDLCIGSPIANRNHSQIEGLMGFFINTLVLRSQINPEENFEQLLQRTRQTCLNAYAAQDVPFEYIVELLQRSQSLSYNPLFQIMFVLQNIKGVEDGVCLSGVQVKSLERNYCFAKFDLILDMSEKNEQLQCGWVYATDLFAAKTIQQMACYFEILLQNIVDNPQQPLKSLPWE